MYVFCGYCVTAGVFLDGESKGEKWTSVKVLLGKAKEREKPCSKAILVKSSMSFDEIADIDIGTYGNAFFDEYGRLTEFRSF